MILLVRSYRHWNRPYLTAGLLIDSIFLPKWPLNVTNVAMVWTFFIDESGDFPSPARPAPQGVRLVGGVAVPLPPKEAEKWAEDTIKGALRQLGAEGYNGFVHACKAISIAYWLLKREDESITPLWKRLGKDVSIYSSWRKRRRRELRHKVLRVLRRTIGESINRINGRIITCVAQGSVTEKNYQPSYLEMLEVVFQGATVICSLAGAKEAVNILVASRCVAKREKAYYFFPSWIEVLSQGSAGFRSPIPKIDMVYLGQILAREARGIQVADVVLHALGARWRRGTPMSFEIVASMDRKHYQNLSDSTMGLNGELLWILGVGKLARFLAGYFKNLANARISSNNIRMLELTRKRGIIIPGNIPAAMDYTLELCRMVESRR